MDFMKTIRAWLPAVLFLWGFLLGMPFYHIPTFTKGPLICALIGQEKSVFEIFTQPHLWTYRPLLVLMFSTLYKLFGFHYEPYRIFASIFSGFFAVFVYLFLLELHTSRKVAFFATLIFTLTTPFLDGLWDLSEGGFYSTCLFYGAFLFFVKLSKCDGAHKLENRYAFLFLLFSLLSLLIKETTRAMAPPILFLYCYFLRANPKQWRLFWIFCGLSVLTLLPVLSAPPEPGSRAAITTPFWEVAKIAFQVNVTQLMSIFHLSTPLLLLFYNCILFVNKGLTKPLNVSRLARICLWGVTILTSFIMLILYFIFTVEPIYTTYFSAKYFPLNLPFLSAYFLYFMAFVSAVAFAMIWINGNSKFKFASVVTVSAFFIYYSLMTFLTAYRLEPSSRHYLLILPVFCLVISESICGLYIVMKRKIISGSFFIPAFILFFGYLLVSGENLRQEFTAIGKSEFAAWTLVIEQGLSDTVVFSPADGYALPPEYLKLAAPDERYVFFQLPRWFKTPQEFESYLHHVIIENNLQNAKKIYYYSAYSPVITYPGDSGDVGQIRMGDVLYSAYDEYNRIGYWQHVLSMHGVFPSHLAEHLSRNSDSIYRNIQVFTRNSTEDPFTPHTHKYFTEIYIQGNREWPK